MSGMGEVQLLLASTAGGIRRYAGMMWRALAPISPDRNRQELPCAEPQYCKQDCNNSTRKDWCYVIIFKGWHLDVPIMDSEVLNQCCLYMSLKVRCYSSSHAFKPDPVHHLESHHFQLEKSYSTVVKSSKEVKYKAASRLLSPVQL